MFKIEKNIPVPPKKPHHKAKYPWLEMEVGDSFFIMGGMKGKAAQLMSGARHYLPRKFTTRVTTGGVRVWRTE